jgi:hypothetical protein
MPPCLIAWKLTSGRMIRAIGLEALGHDHHDCPRRRAHAHRHGVVVGTGVGVEDSPLDFDRGRPKQRLRVMGLVRSGVGPRYNVMTRAANGHIDETSASEALHIASARVVPPCAMCMRGEAA